MNIIRFIKVIACIVAMLLMLSFTGNKKKVNHKDAPCFTWIGMGDECIIPVECDGKRGYICYDISSLYLNLNFKICSLDEFTAIIKKHVLKDIPITVSEDFLKETPMIVKDSAMFQEYKTKGIESLIAKFQHKSISVSEYCPREQYVYFVYLCWQEGYYVGIDDESACLVIYK